MKNIIGRLSENGDLPIGSLRQLYQVSVLALPFGQQRHRGTLSQAELATEFSVGSNNVTWKLGKSTDSSTAHKIRPYETICHKFR